jgi:hypothetical protein
MDARGFPQLAFLLWSRVNHDVSEDEALALYEANRQWWIPPP